MAGWTECVRPRSVANRVHGTLEWLGLAWGHRALLRGVIEVIYYVVVGLGFGIWSFRYYAIRPGLDYRHKSAGDLGYPEIPGLATGVAVLGSALSFLLVFRLSWSFTHWYEARGLIGESFSDIKSIALYVVSSRGRDTAIASETISVLKLHASGMTMDLSYDADSSERPSSPRGSMRLRSLSAVDASVQEQHAALYEHELEKLGKTRKSQVSRTKCRVLLCNSWLKQCVNRARDEGVITDNEHLVAHQHVANLLRSYYSLMKIKRLTAPPAIHFLVFVLKTTYCLCLYPQYLSYAFVMKLDDDQREQRALIRTPYYTVAYVALVTLGIIYFSSLHMIALELDDPFGDDVCDFPLFQWTIDLFNELDLMHRLHDEEDLPVAPPKTAFPRITRDTPPPTYRTVQLAKIHKDPPDASPTDVRVEEKDAAREERWL